MKANELRINNLVFYHIEDAMDERKEWDELGQIDPDALKWLIDHPDFPGYKPVPLTEEWLVKSEHGRKGRNIIIERFCFKWMPQYGYWYVTDESNGCYLTKLEFVHEWQNFYFVMQGQELTIK